MYSVTAWVSGVLGKIRSITFLDIWVVWRGPKVDPGFQCFFVRWNFLKVSMSINSLCCLNEIPNWVSGKTFWKNSKPGIENCIFCIFWTLSWPYKPRTAYSGPSICALERALVGLIFEHCARMDFGHPSFGGMQGMQGMSYISNI